MSIRYNSTVKILLDIVFRIYKMKNLFDQKFLRETICLPGARLRIRRSLYILEVRIHFYIKHVTEIRKGVRASIRGTR